MGVGRGLGNGLGSAAVGCAPAPDLSKQSTGLRPHLFQINPRGRVLVRPSPVE
jgi:hypothetical protein